MWCLISNKGIIYVGTKKTSKTYPVNKNRVSMNPVSDMEMASVISCQKVIILDKPHKLAQNIRLSDT